MLTMKFIDLSFPLPPHNLAFDEALLDLCEDGYEEEILRFWEPSQYFVVLGYSNKISSEVNLKSCEADRVPILRRPSGGGTVLQGPGCLNYSLILNVDGKRPIKDIISTTRYVMENHQASLSNYLSASVEIQGFSDLTIKGKKISGNAQRRRKKTVLFHGTFLLNMPLDLIEKYLAMPSREPDYRQQRSHLDFVQNLDISSEALKRLLIGCWEANSPLESPPIESMQKLVREKYSLDAWNLKF